MRILKRILVQNYANLGLQVSADDTVRDVWQNEDGVKRIIRLPVIVCVEISFARLESSERCEIYFPIICVENRSVIIKIACVVFVNLIYNITIFLSWVFILLLFHLQRVCFLDKLNVMCLFWKYLSSGIVLNWCFHHCFIKIHNSKTVVMHKLQKYKLKCFASILMLRALRYTYLRITFSLQ